jgi:hypothetical protein
MFIHSRLPRAAAANAHVSWARYYRSQNALPKVDPDLDRRRRVPNVFPINPRLRTLIPGLESPMILSAIIKLRSARGSESSSIRLACAPTRPAITSFRLTRSHSLYFSRTATLRFAASVGVHPAVVVGQLQRRGEIPYTHHRNLVTNARHLFPESA